MNSEVKSGVYVIRYDADCIKIGRSEDIESRLKQYSGYRSRGEEVTRLMIIYTTEHVLCEAMAHEFAEEYGLPRYKPYEIFDCSLQTEPAFLEAFREFVEDSEVPIYKIQTRFPTPTKPVPYIRPATSNVTFASKKNYDPVTK